MLLTHDTGTRFITMSIGVDGNGRVTMGAAVCHYRSGFDHNPMEKVNEQIGRDLARWRHQTTPVYLNSYIDHQIACALHAGHVITDRTLFKRAALEFLRSQRLLIGDDYFKRAGVSDEIANIFLTESAVLSYDDELAERIRSYEDQMEEEDWIEEMDSVDYDRY